MSQVAPSSYARGAPAYGPPIAYPAYGAPGAPPAAVYGTPVTVSYGAPAAYPAPPIATAALQPRPSYGGVSTYGAPPPASAASAPQGPAPAVPRSNYSTGLFSLDADLWITTLGCVLPCYVSAKALSELEGRRDIDFKWLIIGSLFCCPICSLIEIWLTRHRVQKAYNIRESLLERVVVMCFFSNCALCQDAREVRIRTRAAAKAASNVSSDPNAPLLVNGQPQSRSSMAM